MRSPANIFILKKNAMKRNVWIEHVKKDTKEIVDMENHADGEINASSNM